MPLYKKIIALAVLVVALGSGVQASELTRSQLIEQLLQQVLVLKQQLALLQGGGNPAPQLIRNLKVGDMGQDVVLLQQILNTNPATAVAVSGLGSKGQETSFFGMMTANAVRRFQEYYAADILRPNGLSVGTGFVGVSTRAKLNQLALQVSPAATTTLSVTPAPVRRGGGGSSSRPSEDDTDLPDVVDPVATTTPAASALCSITATPVSVVAGGSVKLVITTSNAVTGSIDQGVGTVVPESRFEKNITPSKSARYTLTVTNEDGRATSCKTEVVVVPAISRIGLTGVTGQSCVFPVPAALPKQTYYWLDKEYANINGESLRYDMSAPQVEGKYPLIILLHGGGFQGKGGVTKTNKFPEALLRSIAARGYAVATVEYSQATSSATAPAGKNNFPEAIKDVRCAVRYFKSGAHSNLRFIDTDNVGVLGTSAGGHLALLLGTSESITDFDDSECPYNNESAAVQSVAAFYPSTRFRPDAERFQWSNYTNVRTTNDSYIILGTQSNNVLELIKQGSPLYHIEQYTNEIVPPMLIVNSGRERNPALTASVHQLVDSLREKNLPHIFTTEETAYHGFDPFNDFRQSSCYATQFFDETLKK